MVVVPQQGKAAMWAPVIVAAVALALAGCRPAPRIERAVPGQVMIVGDPVAGPVAMPAATATAQELCRQHGRDARYVGWTDTGPFWSTPVLTRVFDCVEPPRPVEPAPPARSQ
jgi:hypothetical protein